MGPPAHPDTRLPREVAALAAAVADLLDSSHRLDPTDRANVVNTLRRIARHPNLTAAALADEIRLLTAFLPEPPGSVTGQMRSVEGDPPPTRPCRRRGAAGDPCAAEGGP